MRVKLVMSKRALPIASKTLALIDVIVLMLLAYSAVVVIHKPLLVRGHTVMCKERGYILMSVVHGSSLHLLAKRWRRCVQCGALVQKMYLKIGL
jgi:hypothetical protein